MKYLKKQRKKIKQTHSVNQIYFEKETLGVFVRQHPMHKILDPRSFLEEFRKKVRRTIYTAVFRKWAGKSEVNVLIFHFLMKLIT